MTSTEARAALPELLDRVAAGEEVTITRHGQAVAVVVRPDALRSRRADAVLASAAKTRALLAEGRRMSLPATGLTEMRADELIAEIRTGRDGRIGREERAGQGGH
jgi:antitoxin (DNA-binding transcriptional repressor) of toxin-antitoxin stability system